MHAGADVWTSRPHGGSGGCPRSLRRGLRPVSERMLPSRRLHSGRSLPARWHSARLDSSRSPCARTESDSLDSARLLSARTDSVRSHAPPHVRTPSVSTLPLWSADVCSRAYIRTARPPVPTHGLRATSLRASGVRSCGLRSSPLPTSALLRSCPLRSCRARTAALRSTALHPSLVRTLPRSFLRLLSERAHASRRSHKTFAGLDPGCICFQVQPLNH